MDNFYLVPTAIFLGIVIICCFGIYSDHVYKMKKLELIEKGIIKEREFDNGK